MTELRQAHALCVRSHVFFFCDYSVILGAGSFITKHRPCFIDLSKYLGGAFSAGFVRMVEQRKAVI
jgi:hypothetical protein